MSRASQTEIPAFGRADLGSDPLAASPIAGSMWESEERLVRYVQAMYPILSGYLPD